MTIKEVEDNDLIIITRDRALEIIAEDLHERLSYDHGSILEFIWKGHRSLREWTNEYIDAYFEGSEIYITEWQVTDAYTMSNFHLESSANH